LNLHVVKSLPPSAIPVDLETGMPVPIARSATWRPGNATLRLRAFCYLFALDVLCIVGGFAAGALVRGSVATDIGALFVLATIVPIYLVVALNGQAYSAAVVNHPFQAIARALRAFLIALSMLILSVFYLKAGQDFSRIAIGLGSVFASVALVIGRYWFVRNLVRIVGGDPYGVALIWEAGQPVPGTEFSLTIAADTLLPPEHSDDPTMYERLALALEGVHNVVVACRPERREAWTNALQGANIQGEILMPELSRLAPLGTNRHGSMTSLVVAHGPLSLVDRAVKRGFDVVVAVSALLVAAPLMLLVAIAIKLESRGPVFFRQVRLGRANRVFRVAKFRSMRIEQTDATGDRSASREDERVTRVGRFIRRTSIDELPQLINVIAGDMSIVGPRPHALGSRAADKLFWEVDGRYWHRHAAKPGLTGLAQVRGFRGATVEEADLLNRLHADLEYLDTWSIWRDLAIIVQTLRVLIHRNAF